MAKAKSCYRKPVLLFTNSEHGQANIVLAVAYEFLLQGEFDVHIASYQALAPRVEHLNEQFKSQKTKEKEQQGLAVQAQDENDTNAPDDLDQPRSAKFHTIDAMSMAEVAGGNLGSLPHPAGVSAAVRSYKNLMQTFYGYDRAQYVVGVNRCADIIKRVNPAALISDSLMFVTIDAAKYLGRECAVLSPLSFKDIVVGLQPKMAAMWKYPQ